MESQNNTKFFSRADSVSARISMRKSVRFAHIEGKISYDEAPATLDIIPPSKITPESINFFCETLRNVDTEVKTISIGSESMKHELHKKLINIFADFISNENYQIRELILKNIIITPEFESLSHLIKIIAATDKKCNLRDLKILDESNFWPNANTEIYTKKQINNINLLHAFVCSMLIECPSIRNVDILEAKLNQTLQNYLTGNFLIELASKTLQNKKLLQEKKNSNSEAENLQSKSRFSL